MNFLIVGARGYLGTGFVEDLSKFHKVISWDIQENLFSLSHSVLKDLNIEAVINFSVLADFSDEHVNIRKNYYSVNIRGIEFMVDLLTDSKIPLVHISTREVIGVRNFRVNKLQKTASFRGLKLINEFEPCHPIHAYGKTKLMSEFIALGYEFGNVIRLNTCYTSNIFNGRGLVPTLVKKSREIGEIRLDNQGKALRDPLHISDLVNLVLKIISSRPAGEIYHAGGGYENYLTLKQICKFANKNVAILNGIKNDDKGFLMDISKAVNDLDWNPMFKLSEFLRII